MSVIRATLCLVVNEGRIVLGRQTRGPFSGYITPPGGKIEAGERPFACAIRECGEETGYTPIHGNETRWLGTIESDGILGRWHVDVFFAGNFQGKLVGKPPLFARWYHIDSLPLEELVPGDQLWLPRVLRGERFTGRHEITTRDGVQNMTYNFDVAAEPPNLW